MSEQDARVFETVARAGREALRRVWARRDEADALALPERRLLAILEAHPEYRAFWEGAEPDGGENPFLHVTLHDVLERQIEADDPPEVRAALGRLESAGLEPHDARHELLKVLVVALGRMAGTRGDFDLAAYRKAVSLVPSGPAPSR